MNKRDIIEQQLKNEIQRFESRKEYLSGKSKKLSLIRLTLFLISTVLFFYFFFSGYSTALYITVALFFILFGWLTSIHNNIDRGIRKSLKWILIKNLHISRMNLEWEKLPVSVFNADEHHPYEFDLSMTGDFSLHRVIDTSSTFEGSRILREWLTGYKIALDGVLERQKVIRELVTLRRFRDKLSLYSSLTQKKELAGTAIKDWINKETEIKSIKRIYLLLLTIIPVNVILFVLYLMNLLPSYFLYVSLVYLAIYWINSRYFKGIFEELLVIEEEFGKLSLVFDFLEKYPYRAGSLLKKLCSVYLEHSPSKYFKSIKNIVNAVSITRNPLVGIVVNFLFPYNFFFAYRLEKIRSEMRRDLPEWMNTWYNLEALNSLSNYAYLNPQCTFPVINELSNPVLRAEEISHPLIHPDENVPNSFTVSNPGEVFIITGSNMSGKSTFLKTLGINLAMCYSGGVVNAASLETSILRIFCCIKISDSVIEGISYFYAEVKRLKILLEELHKSGEAPVFFLIDEIFRGTNNIERLHGSRSYIKETVKLTGTGCVSTHDLELSRLQQEINSVKNYHFREEAVDGVMVFDYKLHPGPCPTTNALKIMKNEGLPVD
jgi:ABC-type multidrug transport system fused ATPase/permease subunit